MQAVRLVTLVFGTFTRVLQAQERHDHNHRGERVRGRGMRRLDEHAAQTHVDRDARELPSDVREADLPALARDRAQFGELVEAVGDRLHVGRVDEPEVGDVLGGLRHTDRQHVEHHGAERRAQDLRFGELRAAFVVFGGVQADRDAVCDAAASSRALVRARLRDRLDRQALHLGRLRIARDARRARVHHIPDARHGERRLRHIGGDDDALVPVLLEHAVLVLRAQAREQRHDLDRVRPAHVCAPRAEGMADRLFEIADVALAGREDEDVARALVVRRDRHEFDTRACHGRGHVHRLGIRIVGAAGRAIGESRHMGHQRGQPSERLIADGDGVGAPGDLDDRHGLVQRVLEVLLELDRVDRGRGDDELEVGPFGQQRGEVAEQEVDVERALVRLVDHDRVIAAQVRVTLDLREEDAVGHHAQPCLRRAFVGEAHLIAHFVAQMHAELTRDAFCHSARGEPARLRVHDLVAMRAAAEFEQDLRQLRRLAGTGLAGDDDDL